MKKEMKIFSFWAVDDIKDIDLMKEQLCRMKALGFTGVVFHPRHYCGDPVYLGDEYMRIVSVIIMYAKSIGMEFWLYDENGWPSGSADGAVISAMPNLRCYWLEMEQDGIVLKSRRGINSLNKGGVKMFVELTHERYKKQLLPEAFDWVGGFFSDEVGFLEGHGACVDRGGIPWSDEIGKRYAEEYGEDIERRLPELFCEEASGFKVWYWEALTDLLRESFYGTIEDWCHKNGKLFTAHLKGEEDPFFQIGYSGSCFRVLSRISVPGIDALERKAGNAFYLRIAASISAQFGSGLAMAEAMGGAGWGLTPGDVKKYTDTLIDAGINMIVFHINQLHLNYTGITDWPSSIPLHQPWRGAFRQLVSDMELRRVSEQEPETLLICPVRGVMSRFAPSLTEGMNEHDGSHQLVCEASEISREAVRVSERLAKAGIRFDVTDEKTVEESGEVKDGRLYIGNKGYDRVAMTRFCVFYDKGMRKLMDIKVLKPEELLSPGSEQSEWIYDIPERNRCFVEIKKDKGTIHSEIRDECILTVSEKCEKVLVNGRQAKLIGSGDFGSVFTLKAGMLLEGQNIIRLTGIKNAFVYLCGSFAVKNRAPFYNADERTLETENEFYITAPTMPDRNLVLSGYPFCDKPVICTKKIKGRAIRGLRFRTDHIAAAHVYVNGEDMGWIYPGRDEVRFEGEMNECSVKCEFYQSAYNIYGPHHHLEGDRPLVSPAQYSGEKNFADTPSLPEFTHDGKMRLLKWEIADSIELI